MMATLLASELIKKQIPYAVEVVGDPYDVFSPGSFKHLIRPLFRWQGYFALKRVVFNSSATLYVTQHTLPKRYPIKNNIFSIGISNVVIKDEMFALSEKQFKKNKDVIKLISVGTLDAMYKSPDVVLKAIKMLHNTGIHVHLTWIGDGRYLQTMKDLSTKLEITHSVSFLGQLPNPQEVCRYLNQADIFLIPSRQEGLPRALVEAMAQGLPCIGTRVGGIPELLDDIALIPQNDENALAKKIQQFIFQDGLASQQAQRNLNVSHQYAEHLLCEQREQFYRKIALLNK
jgi:glycosyltransferase involved in cell wall biosynthesis